MTHGAGRPELGPDVLDLSGRHVIVTGAAQGIGEAIAVAAARFGADVAICDRNPEGLSETAARIAAEGRGYHAGVLDVRDGDSMDQFVDAAVAELGVPHVLVNNAGGTFHSMLLDMSRSAEAAIVAENFTSVTNGVRSTVPHMLEGGSIINVTSSEAHRAGPGFAVYSAMKAAVANLTMSLSMELAEQNIRVNCLAPDAIPTPGDAGLIVDSAATALSEVYDAKPLLYDGHVDDCAGVAMFLACDLSRFVTGSTVHVDGGIVAAGGWRRRHDGGFVL